jgi:hypothetical protein
MFANKKEARMWTLATFAAFTKSLPGQNHIFIPASGNKKHAVYCIAIVAYTQFRGGTYYSRWEIPFGKNHNLNKTSAVLLAHCFAQALLARKFGIDIYQMRGLRAEKISHLGEDET